jgi:hypothetical protein
MSFQCFMRTGCPSHADTQNSMEFKKRGSDTTVHRPDKTPRLTQNAKNTDQYFLLSKKDADTLHIGGGGQFMDSYSYGRIWLHTVKLPG